MSKTKYHHTDGYILNPMHPVTVNVIGCGGTGSHVLNGLAFMNEALLALGHMGLHVTAFDLKSFTSANIGRQLFSPADLGANKAVTLVTRINRFLGNHWRGVPEAYTLEFIKRKTIRVPIANITISCVDTIKSRLEIKKSLDRSFRKKYDSDFDQPYARPIYWFDFGNLQETGQVVLSTVEEMNQPAGAVPYLPDIFSLFPQLETQKDDPNIPSCSVRAALQSQDLFINPILAQNGLNILWKMFWKAKIKHHGLFLNLETIKSNPIEVKSSEITKGSIAGSILETCSTVSAVPGP